MTRGVFRYLVASLVCVGLLSGCRFSLFDRREPWRTQAEEQCLAEKGVEVSAYVTPVSAIHGDGACGMEHPFKISALDAGNVEVKPRAILACPMIRELNVWLDQVVQPAALAWMGQPVVGISQMSSYSCRGMNGDPNAKISEHAFGNALDVGAFRFADGREISVRANWRGPPEARGFLLQVQAGACEIFTTTLAPGANIYHYDHIHVDLMRRNKPRIICKPAPSAIAPPLLAQPDMSRAPPALPTSMPPSQAGSLPQRAMPDAEPGAPSSARPPTGRPNMSSQPLDILPQGPTAVGPTPEPQRGGTPRSDDPFQRVLMPPGTVPNPGTPRPPGPMSYAPEGVSGGGMAPTRTNPAYQRRYYWAPIPQASTYPLPVAEPGAD